VRCFLTYVGYRTYELAFGTYRCPVQLSIPDNRFQCTLRSSARLSGQADQMVAPYLLDVIDQRAV